MSSFLRSLTKEQRNQYYEIQQENNKEELKRIDDEYTYDCLFGMPQFQNLLFHLDGWNITNEQWDAAKEYIAKNGYNMLCNLGITLVDIAVEALEHSGATRTEDESKDEQSESTSGLNNTQSVNALTI